MYFGGSLFATVTAAVSVSRSPRMMNLMMHNSWMVMTDSLCCCCFLPGGCVISCVYYLPQLMLKPALRLGSVYNSDVVVGNKVLV